MTPHQLMMGRRRLREHFRTYAMTTKDLARAAGDEPWIYGFDRPPSEAQIYNALARVVGDIYRSKSTSQY